MVDGHDVSSDTPEVILVRLDRRNYMKEERQYISPKRERGILGLRCLKGTAEAILDEDESEAQEIMRDPQARPELEVNVTRRG